MDHVQQLLLRQLQGAGGGRNLSQDSAGSGGSTDGAVDWAAKAKQWAEEQRKAKILEERRKTQSEEFEKNPQNSNPSTQIQSTGLQGWKDEHPSWFDGKRPPSGHQNTQNFATQIQDESFNAKFLEFQRRNKQKARQNRQNRQNRSRKPPIQGIFPDFNEHDTSRNLPKWMQDEIERIQAKQAAGEELEENDEKNLSELQQLADQEDSDGESSEDDWKKEGRKISEDLAKEAESDSENSDDDVIPVLTHEDYERLKNEVLAATMKSIFLRVTDELTGKISRNVFSKGKVAVPCDSRPPVEFNIILRYSLIRK